MITTHNSAESLTAYRLSNIHTGLGLLLNAHPCSEVEIPIRLASKPAPSSRLVREGMGQDLAKRWAKMIQTEEYSKQLLDKLVGQNIPPRIDKNGRRHPKPL